MKPLTSITSYAIKTYLIWQEGSRGPWKKNVNMYIFHPTTSIPGFHKFLVASEFPETQKPRNFQGRSKKYNILFILK